LSDWASVKSLLLSAALICVNWGAFVYVICMGHTLQSSLAYYINPLVNVLIGMVILGERLRKMQYVCIAIATVAVSLFAWEVGQIPYWSFLLAGSFAGYGFVRRSNPTDSISATTIETMFLTPPALAYLFFSGTFSDMLSFSRNEIFWILASGIITTIPLMLFGGAAKRLRFSTLGLIQYISPTGQFLCAVLVFQEPMLGAQWICFGLIWLTLVLFSIDSVVWNRRQEPEDRSQEGRPAERGG
jgi:chloramphenicol-sensitive protein RarD